MNSMPLSTAATLHAKLRDWLKEKYDLESDEECLSDTLDGISDFKEMAAALARKARYEEAQAEACKGIIADMQARKARREAKAERLRDAISQALQEAGEKRIDAPDMTISLSAGRRKVVPIGEPTSTTCDRFVITETKYRWNREVLKEGLEQGDEAAMELAQFSNETPVLTIRTR